LQVLLCMALSSWMVPVTSLTRGHQVKSLLVFLVFTRYLDVRSGPAHHLDANCYSFWVLCYHYQVKLKWCPWFLTPCYHWVYLLCSTAAM
jgi:hypothetical protein